MENNIITNEIMLNNDASLREYYTRMLSMYNNGVNVLNALNKSLSTSAAEIEVPVADTDNGTSVVRIPSFLYLESKLEELASNMDAIFNIPKDGEAWFTNNGASYKLNLVRSNIAPIAPVFKSGSDFFVKYTDNNFLKDLVFPKMFIRMPLENLPDNISKVLVKKIVINSATTFTGLSSYAVTKNNTNYLTYDLCKSLLYNLQRDIDYAEYDTYVDLPIKKDFYKSNFEIIEVIDKYVNAASNKVTYKVKLNTLLYSNAEDASIVYSLKLNDQLCLGNEMTVYTVTSIHDSNIISIEETIGYASLETTAENSAMTFKIYVSDYSKYNYVDVPLEENQYIIVFVSTIWNNVRSELSLGALIDLGAKPIKGQNGENLQDLNGVEYNYITFYNDFCVNLGDLLMGMSKCVYSQITNYTPDVLEELLTSDEAKAVVSSTINSDVLKVIPINKHLTNDDSSENILSLHNQKNEINSRLQTCQSNIDSVYSTLLTTDFSQNVTISQTDLQSKINEFYTERNELQKQLIAIVDNININSDGVSNTTTKYRIRGISNVTGLEEFISSYRNVEIIGMDVEYKYKTTSKSTSNITLINNTVFTDWNKHYSIDKERTLNFITNGYNIKYNDYSDAVNTIKWNQIDIPIKYGEDVVIRVRYKYSIGQPFITLYTPWSDDLTITFPTEYNEQTEVVNAIDTNNKDIISATFNKTLINEGYTEHIQNKVLSNEQVFFHMPENIYSGFNTAENNLISLKDKLTQMVNDIENYKQYLESLNNSAYDVYLQFDDNSILLTPNSINKINIFNTEHITDMYLRKDMNILFKNTGKNRISFYSIFPGDTGEHIITSSNKFIASIKGDYERVPVFIGNIIDGQYFGQWIYFRQNNPFSNKDIYYNSISQNIWDFDNAVNKNKEGQEQTNPVFNETTFTKYFAEDNNQILLPFRNNAYVSGFNYSLVHDKNEEKINELISDYKLNDTGLDTKLSDFNRYFTYSNYIKPTVNPGSAEGKYINTYIGRFEDIIVKKSGDNSSKMFLTDKTNLSNISIINIGINSGNTGLTKGACLFPNLDSKSQLVVNSKNNVKYLNEGESLSIPIVFEYYVTSAEPTITKSLYFDVKTSLVTDPTHYMIEITGNYDYSASINTTIQIDDIIE